MIETPNLPDAFSNPLYKGHPTTLMIRGIPCSISEKDLMQALADNGLHGKYDFIHLPRKGRSLSNLGYAFVNFLHPNDAAQCASSLDGLALRPKKSSKILTISPAEIQGISMLRKHFKKSRAPMFLNVPSKHECKKPQGAWNTCQQTLYKEYLNACDQALDHVVPSWSTDNDASVIIDPFSGSSLDSDVAFTNGTFSGSTFDTDVTTTNASSGSSSLEFDFHATDGPSCSPSFDCDVSTSNDSSCSPSSASCIQELLEELQQLSENNPASRELELLEKFEESMGKLERLAPDVILNIMSGTMQDIHADSEIGKPLCKCALCTTFTRTLHNIYASMVERLLDIDATSQMQTQVHLPPGLLSDTQDVHQVPHVPRFATLECQRDDMFFIDEFPNGATYSL